MARGVGALELNPLQNLRLRLVAEALQFRHLTGFARGLQLLDGIKAELVVHRLHLLRAETGDAQHLDEARRDGRFQFLVILQPPRRHEFRDLLLQCLADALDVAKPVFLHHLRQRLGQRFDGARAILIRARLERILPLQFQQGADLDQNLRHTFFVHAGSLGARRFLQSGKLGGRARKEAGARRLFSFKV